jgi:hypothetical protein
MDYRTLRRKIMFIIEVAAGMFVGFWILVIISSILSGGR